MTAHLEAALAEIVGPDHVLTGPEQRAPYERDWTGVYVGAARAVVRPATTAEVSRCLAACLEAGAPVVAQGGNTGLVGGSVPDGTATAVVVSTARLSSIGPVDGAAGQIGVGAGVTLDSLQRHLRGSGWSFGVDLGARESATVGGMAATNAGGMQVLRHGTMRSQVAGMESVLASGEVLSRLGGLTKDNTGYDLAGLLCGSEGTLAVITALRLRLVPEEIERTVALVAFPGLTELVAATPRLLRRLPAATAAEYFVAGGLDLVCEQYHLAPPFSRSWSAYLLLEVPAEHDEALGAAVAGEPAVADAAVATSIDRQRALWALRELHTPALATAGPPHKYDVTLPLSVLAQTVEEVVALVRHELGSGGIVHHFGHAGDGNVHFNVLTGSQPDAAQLDRLDGGVYGAVVAAGGSISAEHGIGRLKRRWLHLSRSPSERHAFRIIKDGFDPHGLLNPGVLLD